MTYSSFRRLSPVFISAVAVLASGCLFKVGPDYEQPDVSEFEQFREPTPAGESIANLNWWELFEDPVLRDLIGEAIDGNRDIRVALARIAEAWAQAGS